MKTPSAGPGAPDPARPADRPGPASQASGTRPSPGRRSVATAFLEGVLIATLSSPLVGCFLRGWFEPPRGWEAPMSRLASGMGAFLMSPVIVVDPAIWPRLWPHAALAFACIAPVAALVSWIRQSPPRP